MKISKNKLARQITYKTVIGILPIILRFSNSTGITDVSQLVDYITSLSMDEFLDYKFSDQVVSSDDFIVYSEVDS